MFVFFCLCFLYRNQSSHSTTMCPTNIQTPPTLLSYQQCSRLSEHAHRSSADNVSKTRTLERSSSLSHNSMEQRHNLIFEFFSSLYDSVKLSQAQSESQITNESNDQINLQQVAILEVANSHQFSHPPSCSSSSSCFSHQHPCDSLSSHPSTPSSSSSSSSLFTSSALSIASLFKFFLCSRHWKHSKAASSPTTPTTFSPVSSLKKVLLLSLLILTVSIFSIQIMNSANYFNLCFPIISISLLLCFSFLNHRLSYSPLLIGFLLITTAMKADALGISSQLNSHSMHEVHSMPAHNEPTRKTNSDSSSPSSNPPITEAELEMLKRLGFNSRPNPSRKHKVPQYMLDLYFWFRQTHLESNRERERIRDEEDEDEHSTELSDSNSQVIALTNTDLDDVHRYQEHILAELLADEEERKLFHALHKHHRLDSKRQPSQAPRVSLNGPVNSILSHKLRDHDDRKFQLLFCFISIFIIFFCFFFFVFFFSLQTLWIVGQFPFVESAKHPLQLPQWMT